MKIEIPSKTMLDEMIEKKLRKVTASITKLEDRIRELERLNRELRFE